jgi:hypothetical protein
MKNQLFRLFLVIAVLFLIACAGNDKPAAAGPVPLGEPPAPKAVSAVDGVVTPGEYALTQDFPPFKVSVSRTKDTIRLAVSTKTTGWVAIGPQSQVMDGAKIFMGAVRNGQAVYTEQTGQGHRHSDTAAGAQLATKHAVAENAGTTTLELELPAAKVAGPDAKSIPVILAYSTSDSFTEYHANRRSAVVKLE